MVSHRPSFLAAGCVLIKLHKQIQFDRIAIQYYTQQTQLLNMNKNLINKKRKAQGDALACQLLYFVMKMFVICALYKYQNPLKHDALFAILYAANLIINGYLITTIGNNPGYAPTAQQQQQSFSSVIKDEVCQICLCKKYLRMKHCHQCQRCVYKFDHHCPWIGACVGQFNHSNFWIFLVFTTIQAISTFLVFLSSLSNYSYTTIQNTYSKQYGAIFVLLIIMFFYSMFATTLLGLHTYLICMNITSYQMNKPHKLAYLKHNKNPFYSGIIKNIKSVLFHNKTYPILWLLPNNQPEQIQNA